MTDTQVQNESYEEAPEPIVFTEACVAKVKELLADEENQNMMLRVFVQGGGCQGFQYGFQFEEKPEADDTLLEHDGVTFLVDSLSFQYLVGAEIDFKDDLEGSQFVIRNPNAVTTCSCGSSSAM
jgi:iron-sulfur cluster insertion protein